MKREVYNLEIPSNCPAMTIFGYQFTRVDDYQNRITSLQHWTPVHSEFEIRTNTGKHAVTAYVEVPEHEQEAALAWADGSNATALTDILLLLSIFTRRDVFMVDNAIDDGRSKVIVADSRFYPCGGVLGSSIPYEKRLIDLADPLSSYNMGFEKCLNQIYELIRTEKWKHKYQRGYFLFLAQQAFRSRSPDIAFILCWTIWEHLFAVLNVSWLSKEEIEQQGAFKKIAFLLVEYLKDKVDNPTREQLEPWRNMRNNLIHFGRFPGSSGNAPKHESSDSSGQRWLHDAILFIELTEFIITKTLGLSPSNALNTMEEFDDFLKRKPNH